MAQADSPALLTLGPSDLFDQLDPGIELYVRVKIESVGEGFDVRADGGSGDEGRSIRWKW